jgi:hypothetical protein
VAGDFLIETGLFAGDMPCSSEVHIAALTDLESCALRAVERIRSLGTGLLPNAAPKDRRAA